MRKILDTIERAMIIRQEEPRDYEAVYNLIKEAFAVAEHADGNEQDIVVKLRQSQAFIPQLSLVAEVEGAVVGHILFTKAQVGEVEVLALAPLSVLPSHQIQGVGLALIAEGHRLARELGYGYSVVLGSNRYYPRAGYVQASMLGIVPPEGIPADSPYFMALRLREDAPALSGEMVYAPEFGM